MAWIMFFAVLLAAAAGVIAVFLIFYRFWFLRDPLRVVPSGNSIVSPADGRIIEIRDIDSRKKKSAKITKGKGSFDALVEDAFREGHIITIFMTPFDVHYQRAPYDGKVVYSKHMKGSFRTAEKPRPENENNQVLISTKIGGIKVIQVAGFLARRIVCYAKKGQNIKKGQKIGLIKLGSQVCLMIPKKGKILLKARKGDKVKAGETIIAEVR